MRPYLAIIKDSFRAAMASRVLYVLLLLITVLLIAIAPLHVRETLDWELKNQVNVGNPDRLSRRIVERRDSDGEQPIARIWELLPEKTRTRMIEIVERDEEETLEEPNVPGATPQTIEDIHTYEELIVQLNGIIEDRDFYRAEDWKGKNLPTEARALIDKGVADLSEIRVKRLNRLLIATAVSPTVDSGNSTALDFHYAIWRIPFTVSLTHQQFAQTLTSDLPVYFDKFVMSIGLLIAIVVTANMIPETFEPGSLNLLLSKPVSRWGLYSAKFFGGCVFIALSACYLFLGLWLWLGLAMDVWDRAILFSIPLYVLVFAIYFSVSALVGLIWRSAIVSVILTLLFWAVCFTVGSVYGVFHTKMRNTEFINLLPVNEEVYATDLIHQVSAWNETEKSWDQKLEAELGQQGAIAYGINSYMIPLREMPGFPGLDNFLAPIYDQEHSRILTSRYEFGKSLATGKKKLFVSDASKLDFQQVGHFPRDTVELFNTDSGILAVSSDGGLHRLDETKFALASNGKETDDEELPEFDKQDDFYVVKGRVKNSSELIEGCVELIRTDSGKDSDSETAFGNNPKAKQIASEFISAMSTLDKQDLPDANESAIDTVDYLAYCFLSKGRCALLVRVPQFRKFSDSAEESLESLTWTAASNAASKHLDSDFELGVGLRGLLEWGSVMTGVVGSNEPKADYDDEIGALATFFVAPPKVVKISKKRQAIEKKRNDDLASMGVLFNKIGPDQPTSIRSAQLVDYSHARNEFAIYQRGQLKVYRADGDRFKQHATLPIDLGFDKNMTCMLAYQGDTILLAFGNGKIITVDAANLTELNDYHPESRSGIQQVGGSIDGKHFAVLYRNGNLWMLDTDDAGRMSKADVTGQGRVSSFAFGHDGQFWVSDNTDRATRYEVSGASTKTRYVPTGGWIQRLYRYALRPFYKACPKPGEFYKVVTHLSSSGDTERNADVDMNKTLQASDPWSPLWSGLAFMFAMLAIGCIIFQFKDY